MQRQIWALMHLHRFTQSKGWYIKKPDRKDLIAVRAGKIIFFWNKQKNFNSHFLKVLKYVSLINRECEKRNYIKRSSCCCKTQEWGTAAGERPYKEIKVKEYIRRKCGRKKLGDATPTKVIYHDIPEEEKICACGCRLKKVGENSKKRLRIIPSKMYAIGNVYPKYACPNGSITRYGPVELRTSFVQLFMGMRHCKDTKAWRMMQRLWIHETEQRQRKIYYGARKTAEIVWALLSYKIDLDAEKMKRTYKPLSLTDQAPIAVNI